MDELVVENVSMVFDDGHGGEVHALEHVSFSIARGEILTVLGPSGCGKTTLLNIIAGFLAPTSGTVRAEGAAVTGQPGGDRAVVTEGGYKDITGPGADRGMVFQQGALFEWLSVADNISFGPRMKGATRREYEPVVDRLLRTVGLAGFGAKPVYQLSGGMQQRVALARCLANDPDIILMDEPLGALDALTREKMQGLILKLWKETRKTIIIITHSVEEALFLGERLFVMAPRPGRIVKEVRLPFADRGLVESPREIKASAEFIAEREEILSMIWEMEEEIMGHDI